MIAETEKDRESLDVAVIGGGPAGVSACLGLARDPCLAVALFESECEIGGIPRSCHYPFGMRDLRRVYRGDGYVRELRRRIQKTSTRIYADTTVVHITPNTAGGHHLIATSSARGFSVFKARFLLLATGCCERSRGARLIAGTRPSGIFTTGTFQEMVNFRGQRPGRRAVVVGSEYVALSAILTARKAGMSIAALLEENRRFPRNPLLIQAASFFFGFPVFKGVTLRAIQGVRRVEGIEVLLPGRDSQEVLEIHCDTVILTGDFRPETTLLDNLPFERDPLTCSPIVNERFMTSIPNIFAAGNVLSRTRMHDLCAIEGRRAARAILAATRT